MKKMIKRFRNIGKRGEKTALQMLPGTFKKREIVNFPMFEKVEPAGLKTKIIQKFRKHLVLKIWYYVDKSPENPKGTRKEHFVSLPDTGEKYIGYIEKETENIFMVNRSKNGRQIFSVNNGKVFPMKSFFGKTSNQEVKKYLAG